MAEPESEQEQPCLHCMDRRLLRRISACPGWSDKVDTEEADEVIEAIAKTVAKLTSRQDGIFRQHLVERLMQEIIKFDDEFRREDAVGTIGSHARH